MKLNKRELYNMKVGTKLVENDMKETEWIKIFNQRFVCEEDDNFYSAKQLYKRDWKSLGVPSENVKEILDDKEKNYLSSIIKPFRGSVAAISKQQYRIASPNSNRIQWEYITIWVKRPRVYGDISNHYAFNTDLPCFKPGTMYVGMERGHKYTLEELGL